MKLYGEQWPQPPNPYATPVNIPPRMRRLPFNLLRSHLPVTGHTTMDAIIEARDAQPPDFMFTRKGGPRNHAPDAAGAVSKARGALRALRDAALAAVGAPPVPDYPPMLPEDVYPRADARMWPHPPPGYGTDAVFYTPRSGLPFPARERQEQLRQMPAHEGMTTTGVPPAVQRALARVQGMIK